MVSDLWTNDVITEFQYSLHYMKLPKIKSATIQSGALFFHVKWHCRNMSAKNRYQPISYLYLCYCQQYCITIYIYLNLHIYLYAINNSYGNRCLSLPTSSDNEWYTPSEIDGKRDWFWVIRSWVQSSLALIHCRFMCLHKIQSLTLGAPRFMLNLS